MTITIPKERYDYVFKTLVENPPPGCMPLRPFQLYGIEYALKHNRMVLGDDKGTGKTVQILAVLYLLDIQDCCITCSKSALSTWGKEIKKWFPNWNITVQVIEGQAYKRAKQWKIPAQIKVSTYKSYQADLAKGLAPVYSKARIYDEIKVRNRKTQTFTMLCSLKSEFLYPTTGSPVRRGAQDLWTLMYLCNKELFPSYWKFVNTFCIIEDGFFGREIVGMKNTKQLRELIAPHFLRRSKKDPEIAAQMQPKMRDFIDIELDPQIRKLYQGFYEDMLISIQGYHFSAKTVLDASIKCRQLLTCPKLIDESLPIGQGIEDIVQHIDDYELDKAVIFSYFPACFKYIQPYLEAKGFEVRILRGGTPMKEVEEIAYNWFSQEGKRQIVLNSILFAESYDLVQSGTGYVLGASYDVEDNSQAEDRLHRMSSIAPVDIYYVRFKDTIDDRVFNILDGKAVNITHTLKGAAAAAILLRGDSP